MARPAHLRLLLDDVPGFKDTYGLRVAPAYLEFDDALANLLAALDKGMPARWWTHLFVHAPLLSGRFPFVSPTARVSARDCVAGYPGLMSPGSASYVTDGGYLDNSGASTALRACRALEPLALARERAGGRA